MMSEKELLEKCPKLALYAGLFRQTEGSGYRRSPLCSLYQISPFAAL